MFPTSRKKPKVYWNDDPTPRQNLTMEQLAAYNGKNGKPAYVAVDGIIYDVTENAAWAAASHFGLQAGRDVTAQFNSCHAGQQILDHLKVVGKLI